MQTEENGAEIDLGGIAKGHPTEEEIAGAVCYLASDEAAFVTGMMLDINGGGYFG